MIPSSTFARGKLKLKGDKERESRKKLGKKTSTTEHLNTDSQISSDRSSEDPLLMKREANVNEKIVLDELTEAERRAKRFKLERQKKDLEKISELSHRERIEKFNENLSKLTELNDIPRVSAAGNG
jgi:protein FAM32A